MACPITPHYILSTLPIGIIIRYPGKFVLHFWACVRTQATFVLFFFFLRTAVRRLDTGCLLLAHWPRGVRTKSGLFSLVGTSGLHVKDIKAVRKYACM